MAYNHEYPYFSADNANVDWFLDFVNRLHKEWEDMKKEWNNVLSEWDGMKNTWEEYRQELENRFGEFTTEITNQFGALRLEFTDLKQEFNALKTYVETQINNLPDEVKNIFQTYIDDGTILEMITPLLPTIPEELKEQVEKNKNDIAGLTASLATLTTTVEGHTTQITNLTTKVNQNTTDIRANAGNIAKNTTDIRNNKLNIQNLTTTVGQHTTEISNIKREQTEIMNDIADINTLDTEQNNRLTALENRKVSTQEHFWLLISKNLPNLRGYITTYITSFIETVILSAGFDEANTVINTNTPSKKPTRIIIIVDDTNTSSDVVNVLTQIASIAETAKKKYPGVHVYCTLGPSPIGTVSTIQKMSNMLNRITRYSSIIRNPFIHLCIRPILASYPNVAKNDLGDFTSSHKVAYEYVLELFNSIFAPQFGDSNIVFRLTIQLALGSDASGLAHMILVLHNSYIEMYIEAEMPGANNSNFDIAGRTGESVLGTISGIYYPYMPLFIPNTTAALSFFSRDNRSSGTHSAIIWFNNQTDKTQLTISNRDFDAPSIVNGYTITSRKFFNWSTIGPFNA